MTLTLHARLRQDPTRTITLRRRYEADMVRRFKRLRRDIAKSVAENDAFGLKSNRPVPPGQFAFPRDASKVEAFMGWLREQMNMGILEIIQGTPLSGSGHRRWQDIYLASAYQKGIAHAANRMKGAGANVADRWIDAAFLRPVHADRAGLIFTRAFEELQGVTDTMAGQISRELAQGLIEGRNPRDIARGLADRVDKIGITRARRLARTEVISAHAEASLNTYMEAGMEGVTVEAEFSTAGDSRVCPQCRALEGNVYTIEKARGLIPVHPNCRCAFIPIVPEAKKVDLR